METAPGVLAVAMVMLRASVVLGTGHVWHKALAVADLKVAVGHGTQNDVDDDEPDAERRLPGSNPGRHRHRCAPSGAPGVGSGPRTDPAGHAHCEARTAPRWARSTPAVTVAPAGHFVHAELPVAGLNSSAAHVMHARSVGDHVRPGGHVQTMDDSSAASPPASAGVT
jgi:hypothetical protein